MSADDVKGAFPALTLNLAKRDKLARLLSDGKFKKARELKEELDGPLPRGQVVRLRTR